MALFETAYSFVKSVDFVLFLLLGYITYSLLIAIYNLIFHPLAKYPGPWLRGAFYFPIYWEIWTGNLCKNNIEFHKKYGSVVRISPTALSFNNAQAWQDIYGQRHGKKQIPKDPTIYVNADGVADIVVASDADHTRIRRLLSHAFSESALYEQESLQKVYFDLFIQKLKEKVDGREKGKVDMVSWFNFATFDLIGDLAFGESFNALKNGDYHPWIASIVNGFRFASVLMIFRAYPVFGAPIMFLAEHTPALHRQWKKHVAFTTDKCLRRLNLKTDRKDIMSYILRHNDEKGMTEAEIIKNSGALILAGSETSSTMLSGLLYHLLLFPQALEKLTQEIRSTFPQSSEICFTKLQGLTYLNACIREGFRVYPPTPMILPRRTVAGGAIIDGRFVPENTSVGVHQWSATRSESNFYEPSHFIPERWIDLNDARFKNDNREALQPFSLGPRNCIGRHLAMAQMRNLLSRLIWHFDVTLCDESRNWLPQKVFLLWDKPDLMVILKARKDKR